MKLKVDSQNFFNYDFRAYIYNGNHYNIRNVVIERLIYVDSNSYNHYIMAELFIHRKNDKILCIYFINHNNPFSKKIFVLKNLKDYMDITDYKQSTYWVKKKDITHLVNENPGLIKNKMLQKILL